MRRTLFPCLVLGSIALVACGGVATEPTGTSSSAGGGSSASSASSAGGAGTSGTGGAGSGGEAQGTGGQAPVVDSIAIVPGPDLFCNDSCFLMPAGDERQFVAMLLDADGNPRALRPHRVEDRRRHPRERRRHGQGEGAEEGHVVAHGHGRWEDRDAGALHHARRREQDRRHAAQGHRGQRRRERGLRRGRLRSRESADPRRRAGAGR